MTQPPLTTKKRRWVGKRKVTLRGKTLNYNISQQEKYSRALRKLVREMTSVVKSELARLFRGEIADEYFEQQKEIAALDASIASNARILLDSLLSKFTQLFDTKAKPIAETMVNGAAAVSKTALTGSLKQLSGGLSLNTGVVPKGMEEVAKATVTENVSLIRSIPAQYFKDVTGAVMRSITSGRGMADLLPEIKKYDGQTDRRAKNLALDQTRKAYNSINKQRLLKLNVKTFQWIHSGGGQQPRESHIKISGHIFSFDNLEAEQAILGVPKEDQGIPGYPVNCRCTMLPVINFDDSD